MEYLLNEEQRKLMEEIHNVNETKVKEKKWEKFNNSLNQIKEEKAKPKDESVALVKEYNQKWYEKMLAFVRNIFKKWNCILIYKFLCKLE